MWEPMKPAPPDTTARRPSRFAKLAGLSQELRVGRDHLQGRPPPGETGRVLQSGRADPVGELRVGDQLRRLSSHGLGVPVQDQDAGVPGDLRKAGVGICDGRCSARHRLQDRQPETFIAAREDKACCGREKVHQLLLAYGSEKACAGQAGRCLGARTARDHEVAGCAGRLCRLPGPKQIARALACVECPDVDEIGPLQTPSRSHLLSGAGGWAEGRIDPLEDHPQPAGRDAREAAGVGCRRFRDGEDEVG